MGDRVDVTRTEALTVAVQPAATATANADALLHRLTFSVQFGWTTSSAAR